MTTAPGVDGLTYTLVTISNSITSSITDSSLNFYGNNGYIQTEPDPDIPIPAIDVFSVPLSTTVTSFTNSGIILGGGGYGNLSGANGLTNSGSTTTLTNKGAFLGGGGGGNSSYGGAGGGGGGSYPGGNGGSIIGTTTNGSNAILISGAFYGGGGGGGPSGNGGTSRTTGSPSITYSGGIGQGAPGANGSSGGNGSSCISSIFTFGGGGGACSGGFTSTGGGGYGGGDGGDSANGFGGGGGGGGKCYRTSGANTGSNGGYGIVNTGTITTLNNGQGGTYTVTNDGNTISYGPLFYSGTLPTNYNMIINASGTQSSAQYGQLWCTGWNNSSDVSGNLNFGMDYTDSSLNFYTTTQGTSYTYVSALVLSTNITVNGTSGTFNTGVSTGTVKVFNWALSDAYEITLNGTNYRSYDVTLTLSYVYTFNHFTISTYHSNYNNSGNNYYGSNTSNSYDVFNVSASILSFTNTGIILGGGGLGGSYGATANNGKHGLNNSGSITTLTNKGAFLGGGGNGAPYTPNGSTYGGAGGGGGGDGSFLSDNGGNGGSIVTNINGSNGRSGGGGGPGGNGGKTVPENADGGDSYGPFGGGGAGTVETYNAGPYYGGLGGKTDTYRGSGGGGYGGGNGGPTTSGIYGGGGGGGGTGKFNAGAGNGGYSIYNSGTIVTLNNLQGGTIAESPDYFYPFGPLFYTGPLPTNYNIIINSSSNYGQLWCTGWNSSTVSGNLIFGIDTTNSNSYLFGTTTLSNVLVLPTTTQIQSLTGTSGNFTWQLIGPTSQTINDTVYNRYDLQVTLPYTCFHPDSKILSWKNGKEGNYPISSLRKGDFVKTYKHGYLKIDGIGKTIVLNPGNNERVKSRLYRLTNKEFPELFEDLIITGCHSLLVDSLTEEQKQKILETYGEFKITNDKYRLEAYLEPKAKPWEEECEIEVWHLALECQDYYKNYGIWANGLLVETISKRGLKEYSGMELIE